MRPPSVQPHAIPRREAQRLPGENERCFRHGNLTGPDVGDLFLVDGLQPTLLRAITRQLRLLHGVEGVGYLSGGL